MYNNNQCNEIDVFKDRIEIHTTGGFPKGHTPEEFLDGSKKAIRRNKLITGVLYYSKDMETFATGLKRIKDSNFAHRFCLCTLKIQYLAGIRLSKFTLCPMPPEAVSSTKQAMCS